MPLNGSVSLSADLLLTGANALTTLQSRLVYNWAVAIANGVGQGQAQVLWASRRTLASGANENIDLNGAGFVDDFGTALAITKVKGLLIQPAIGNTTDLTIGNVANGLATILGAATQSFVLHPGELFAKVTPDARGYVVTPGTADLLRIVNGAGAVATFDIAILGV